LPLAVFTDRYTRHYHRHYAHPIELVWEAVSTSEHLDGWLLATTRVEHPLLHTRRGDRAFGRIPRFGSAGGARHPAADRTHHLDELVAGRPDAEYARLVGVYRDHVRVNCPPA